MNGIANEFLHSMFGVWERFFLPIIHRNEYFFFPGWWWWLKTLHQVRFMFGDKNFYFILFSFSFHCRWSLSGNHSYCCCCCCCLAIGRMRIIVVMRIIFMVFFFSLATTTTTTTHHIHSLIFYVNRFFVVIDWITSDSKVLKKKEKSIKIMSTMIMYYWSDCKHIQWRMDANSRFSIQPLWYSVLLLNVFSKNVCVCVTHVLCV